MGNPTAEAEGGTVLAVGRAPQGCTARRRTRVLFVNTRDDLGADVAVHLLLARHLGAAGVDVTFTINQQAVGAARMLDQLQAAPDVDAVLYPLGRPAGGRTYGERARMALGNLTALGGFWRLASLVRRQRIDVLHTTDRPRDALLCTLLGRVTGRPSVIQMHSNYVPSMSRISRWAFAHCTCVLGISAFTSRSMEAAGVPAERLATVLNAVDVNQFDPDHTPRGEARARWQIPDGAPLIGIIGRLIRYKGHEDLLDALAGNAALAQVHLLIVGEETGETPDYTRTLRTHATRLDIGDRVHFTGLQDVRSIYADLDLLAVPSWEEPFGLVVVEAMAMQVPVVAYRSGGIPEIVRSGVEGLLVRPRATAEFAEALACLLGDSHLRARFGAAGRRRVLEHFTPARQASEMAALYQRLSSRKGAIANVTAHSR